MPLVYSNPAYAAATVETAQKVGAGKKAERQTERQQQMDMAVMEIKARRELAQFEADMRIQSNKLAQAWELEKMQRQSELDFQFEQQKITLARNAITMKESMAKDKYLSYVDHIDADHTLSPYEKTAYKRRAYDSMVANIDNAERVYWPEKFADGGSALSSFTGGGAAMGGAGAPVGADARADARYYLQQARLQNPNASPQELAAAAKNIHRDELANQFMDQLASKAPAGFNIGKLQERAYTMADQEIAVRQGYEESKALGYKPTLYQQTESAVQGFTKKFTEGISASVKSTGTNLQPFGLAPAAVQQKADMARRESRDGAVDSIIKEWLHPSEKTLDKWSEDVEKYPRTSSLIKRLRVFKHKRRTGAAERKANQEARRERFLGILKQQGGYTNRSEIVKQGLPSLYQ